MRMSTLFQRLEDSAARGAAGLAAESRVAVTRALLSLQRPDGGFAGLDGRSDPYYTLFAWLGLRALGAGYDRDRVCTYMQVHRRDANPMDTRCARFVLAAEGRGHRASWPAAVASLVRGDAYGAFLALLSADRMPRWLARLAQWHQPLVFSPSALERLPTPRLAAGLILERLSGRRGTSITPMLASRRCPDGGFAAAPGAPADLLATAVARFALGVDVVSAKTPSRDGGRDDDLAFVEACWLDDGLFGASPAARQGDAEHTFYGLLALGTCR